MKPVEAISFAEEKMGFSDYLKSAETKGTSSKRV